MNKYVEFPDSKTFWLAYEKLTNLNVKCGYWLMDSIFTLFIAKKDYNKVSHLL